MKVYLGKYRSRVTSHIYYNYMNKKYKYVWSGPTNKYEKLLEGLEDTLNCIYNHSINMIIDRLPRVEIVKIDRYDTWAADETLAKIIVPLLVQLKNQKQGSPYVDDSDVPPHLRNDHIEKPYCSSTPEHLKNKYTELLHQKWDYIIDEMIFAFKSIEDSNNPLLMETSAIDEDRVEFGLKMFGKYYRSLWT